MKKQLSLLILLGLGLSFSSCSIQQRRYNKGLHLDWFSSSNTVQKKEKSTIPRKERRMEAMEHQLVSAQPELANDVLRSALDLKWQQIEPIQLNNDEALAKQAHWKKQIPLFKSGMRPQKVKDAKAKPKPDGRSQMLKGVMYMVIGGIIFLFINTIVGIILGIIGFFLFLIGIGNLSRKPDPVQQPAAPPKDEEKPEYQDVVYLKNGSIIRGMIIEQIPNKSIKIQTKDGNVFVYEMDEIEKITKEAAR